MGLSSVRPGHLHGDLRNTVQGRGCCLDGLRNKAVPVAQGVVACGEGELVLILAPGSGVCFVDPFKFECGRAGGFAELLLLNDGQTEHLALGVGGDPRFQGFLASVTGAVNLGQGNGYGCIDDGLLRGLVGGDGLLVLGFDLLHGDASGISLLLGGCQLGMCGLQGFRIGLRWRAGGAGGCPCVHGLGMLLGEFGDGLLRRL